MKGKKLTEMTEKELFELSLKKKKNGCATMRAYRAQCRLWEIQNPFKRPREWMEGMSYGYHMTGSGYDTDPDELEYWPEYVYGD